MTIVLSRTDALAIEAAELDAWRDMYSAIPDSFRRQHEPELLEIDGAIVMRCRSIPFVHFNAALNLGLQAPATEATVDAIVAAYRAATIRRFAILHNPMCLPAALTGWLESRGFQARPGWDRVFRLGGSPAPDAPPARGDIIFVSEETAATWAGFLDGWYRLPTSPWLAALVGRRSWRHAMLVRDGKPVAARSMFVQSGRSAWFGVEAPIPGLMAPSFDDDHCLLHALMAEAIGAGAQVFAGDVEAPNESRSGAAYDRWTALGFAVAYHRTHYVYDGEVRSG